MDDYGYGLWLLVVVNSLIFIVFAASFFHPRSSRDWRALGGFSAFVIALFTEMYGYPLTVYLLTGPLGGLIPGVDLSHDAGHLWADLIGWKGDPHVSPFHLASYGFIIGGFWLIAAGWRVLFAALKAGTLATTGPYARLRHPQYAGFALIMIGFLLQWPTLATLVMFPVLLLVYRRLAVREEQEVEARFGEVWRSYAAHTPRFFPRLGAAPQPPRGANRPQLIFADEPTANLDSAHGAETMRLLRQLAKNEETTVVIVSDDQRLREIADRVLWLEDGQLKRLEALERDPVCGMLLDPAQAPASLEADGETLYFCSRGCLMEYEERNQDPANRLHPIVRAGPEPSNGVEGGVRCITAPSSSWRSSSS